MKRWIFLIAGILLLALIAAGVYAWLASPSVVDFSPLDGATDVPARSSIQIDFSQLMRPASVEHLLTTDPPRSGKYDWNGSVLTFTPDLPWPGGTQVRVHLEAGGRAEGGLGLPIWQDQSWSFNTAQALLAYLWPSDGPADLYVLDPLSGEVRQLTEQADILDYSISQDGLLIYFSAGNTNVGADLYRLDLIKAAQNTGALTQPELILACEQVACRSPKASPNGVWLVYERIAPGGADSAQIWLLDLATGKPSQLGEAGHVTENPAWSAENLLAYYDKQQAGYVMINIETGQHFLAPNSTGDQGVWSPDGTAFIAPEITYVQATGGTATLGSSHLIRYTPFGPSIDLTQTENTEDTAPAFSSDSGMLAFARKYLDEPRWSFGRQIWLMNVDGSQPRQITSDDLYNHFDFAWSWDGRWLAYVRFENASYTGQLELWLRNADGSNPIQLNFGGYSPQWIP